MKGYIMSKKVDLPTDASYIYDMIYGHLNKNNKLSSSTKSARIEKILADMDFEEKTVIRACCRYETIGAGIDVAVKMTNINRKKVIRLFKQIKRHMYSPLNISIAIPNFYKLKLNDETKFTDSDFGGQKYISRALIKAGLDTREKLYKHLSLGWYYLWTIPGCGDNARQSILISIDNWCDTKSNFNWV